MSTDREQLIFNPETICYSSPYSPKEPDTQYEPEGLEKSPSSTHCVRLNLHSRLIKLAIYGIASHLSCFIYGLKMGVAHYKAI